MDQSTIIVVVLGTLLFLGFPIWLTIHARRNGTPTAENNERIVHSEHTVGISKDKNE